MRRYRASPSARQTFRSSLSRETLTSGRDGLGYPTPGPAPPFSQSTEAPRNSDNAACLSWLGGFAPLSQFCQEVSETPMASAHCCCVKPLVTLAFFILSGRIMVLRFYTF